MKVRNIFKVKTTTRTTFTRTGRGAISSFSALTRRGGAGAGAGAGGGAAAAAAAAAGGTGIVRVSSVAATPSSRLAAVNGGTNLDLTASSRRAFAASSPPLPPLSSSSSSSSSSTLTLALALHPRSVGLAHRRHHYLHRRHCPSSPPHLAIGRFSVPPCLRSHPVGAAASAATAATAVSSSATGEMRPFSRSRGVLGAAWCVWSSSSPSCPAAPVAVSLLACSGALRAVAGLSTLAGLASSSSPSFSPLSTLSSTSLSLSSDGVGMGDDLAGPGGGRKRSSSSSSSSNASMMMATMMPPLGSIADHLPLAKGAMKYFDSSPDPFHVVQTSSDMLHSAGFVHLDESKPFAGRIEPGGRYYYSKNRSTLVAFAVGGRYKPGNGFKIIGGHSDSPNLRIKPRSKRRGGGGGCIQLAVECYGGGLWHTWFDRDLGLSGRVLVRRQSDGLGVEGSEEVVQKLIKIDRPIVRIPNLAIHLQTAKEREAFAINKEDHLSPILAMEVKRVLTGGGAENSCDGTKEGKDGGEIGADGKSVGDSPSSSSSCGQKDGWTEYQEPILLRIIANELGIEVDDVADFELNLYDVQPSSLGGAYSEFIHSARLDNLASCYLALRGLIEHSSSSEDGAGASDLLANDGDISLVALFDHEEVGSTSSTGAGSPIMAEAVRRISSALHDCAADAASVSLSNPLSAEDLYASALTKSFVLSVDQAHAVHPNYASKHEKGHAPLMNCGMVIKRNSNQRYATNAVTAFIVREIGRRAGLPPVQEFVVRNDCGCGSTIGPVISAATGIRAVDMGCPQLSMHSIRETMGVCDLTHGLALFRSFFRNFREVDSSTEQ